MPIRTSRPGGALAAAALLLAATVVHAHEPRVLTDADYARAESFLSYNTRPLVDHAVTTVVWQDDGHFWFKDHDASGDHFKRVDAATGTITPAFDHEALAAALGEATDEDVDPAQLPVTDFSLAADGRLDIEIGDEHYLCDLQDKQACVAARGVDTRKPSAEEDTGIGDEPTVESPDGQLAAFIRDWNLWVRDTDTGEETRLTTDGVEDYGYATDNAGWTHSDRPILVWSPDSSKIATFQQDQRKTGEMVLVGTNVGHPKVERWKYPLAGDEHVTMIERVIIDVSELSTNKRRVVRLDMPPDQHRSTLCDDVSCYGGWEDVQWAPDGQTLAFASTSRDHRDTWLRVADAQTGAVRTVYHEHVPTYFESGNGRVNWKYLPESNEFIWFSERSNWGHLYLYDLGGADGSGGELKHPITTGVGNVTQVLHVDPDTRTLWFRGVGMEDGRNPYYQHFYKVGFDGGEPQLLTPEDSHHTITMSPDGSTFVDAYSTPTTPPVTVLRDSSDGHVIAELARADIGRLQATGWMPPEPFTVKARDGETTLYGLMFKPTDFDPSQQYPLVVYIYPGPQTGSVRGRSFRSARGDHQALAELGFVVIAVDGMGTPYRSKAFHDAFDGDIGDNTLPDQVAAVKQLGARFDWIDLDRVGIWGHSGGGYATADAMFTYPDLFKVGIAESGNHDNRNYEDDWIEKWMPLQKIGSAGNDSAKDVYQGQANAPRAENLQGDLLLAHGTLDDNVPPYNTLLVVDALIKANKDFDLLMIPNARHGYGKASRYMTRRRWDYFVENLMGAVPPEEYRMEAYEE